MDNFWKLKKENEELKEKLELINAKLVERHKIFGEMEAKMMDEMGKFKKSERNKRESLTKQYRVELDKSSRTVYELQDQLQKLQTQLKKETFMTPIDDQTPKNTNDQQYWFAACGLNRGNVPNIGDISYMF